MAVNTMISVAVSINGSVLFARSAHRIKDVPEERRDGYHQMAYSLYKVDDGSEIRHFRNEGAIVLAKKLLDTIKED